MTISSTYRPDPDDTFTPVSQEDLSEDASTELRNMYASQALQDGEMTSEEADRYREWGPFKCSM